MIRKLLLTTLLFCLLMPTLALADMVIADFRTSGGGATDTLIVVPTTWDTRILGLRFIDTRLPASASDVATQDTLWAWGMDSRIPVRCTASLWSTLTTKDFPLGTAVADSALILRSLDDIKWIRSRARIRYVYLNRTGTGETMFGRLSKRGKLQIFLPAK